jgi:hypothetical protein
MEMKKALEADSAAYRAHLPDLSIPRFQTGKTQDAYEYSNFFNSNQAPPWLYNLTKAWETLLEAPFKGVTVDGKCCDLAKSRTKTEFRALSRMQGTVVEGLFQEQDEGVAIEKIVQSVQEVFAQLTPAHKSQLCQPLSSKAWRSWSNPEMLLRPLGLRLEEVPEETAKSILAVVESTFSAEGYAKALAAMRINHFLGELVEMPRIMNKYSYNFLVFGEPSATEAWGWSMYGHHLCLNVFLRGRQIIISPTFTGAEPNLIDEGEWRGTEILHAEGNLGLKLMQGLPKQLQAKAQVFKLLHDPGMLQTGDLCVDRWNKDDQRHLCGAFRDNRVVPYEGVRVSDMDAQQQQSILDIAEQLLLYLPESARIVRKNQIKAHFDQTYFSWIGGFSDNDPFYYRVQSPIIIFEFDHHSGVFLTNTEPAKFHTHTIVRTPNGGDYGNALRRQEDKLL